MHFLIPKRRVGCSADYSADMEIEWTGHQQFTFFLQSVLVGVTIGLIFGVFNGISHIRHSRCRTFVLDVLFCVLAAMITFFASLVIMDGQLHPLLFIGVLIGAAPSYVLVGRRLSKLIALVGRFVLTISHKLSKLVSRILAKGGNKCKIVADMLKNAIKSAKNARFFSKKT